MQPRSRARAHRLRAQRGASASEYLILVAVVAVLGIAAFRAFGSSVTTRVEREAICIASMDGSACKGGSATTPGLPPPVQAGNPSIGNVRGGQNAAYVRANGRPFIAGNDGRDVHPSDISQGQIGDCYLMASLAAVAHVNPDVIRNNIRDLGDGRYAVTFYDPGLFRTSTVEVVVTAEFPNDNGRWVFAQPGDADGRDVELWPMLYEKAYAVWRGNGSYENIVGGYPYRALTHITGSSGSWTRTRGLIWNLRIGTVADYADRGYALVASSLPDSEGNGKALYRNGTLVTGHAYWIERVDREAGTVTLRNPWGWSRQPITLRWEEFLANFSNVHYAATR